MFWVLWGLFGLIFLWDLKNLKRFHRMGKTITVGMFVLYIFTTIAAIPWYFRQ